MKLFQNLVRRTDASKRGGADLHPRFTTKERTFIERTLHVPIHKFSDYHSYLQAGCKKVWASFRACHLVGNMVLGATFGVVRLSKDGSKEAVEGTELNALLETPNPYDSWEEMIYLWVFHMKLTGNAYWLKDEVNGRGQPLHLYPLLPQYIEPVPDGKSKVLKYLYKVNGRVIEYKPEEIIHFRRPHPSDLHLGIGDVEPAEALFNDYINRNSLEEKFLENGATPSGIMTREDADDMDPTEFAMLKARWREEYSGKSNAGKVMFLGGKWKYEKLGLTAQEMQSIERSRMTIEEIFMAHGVPLSIAGIQGSANYATARQDDINFRQYEIVPLINLLVGKLNTKGTLALTFDESWRVDFNLAGLINVEQMWKDYGPAFTQGIMTGNEVRAQMGLPRVDNPALDAFFAPNNKVPIEDLGQAPDQEQPSDGPGRPDTESKTPWLDFLEMEASIVEDDHSSL